MKILSLIPPLVQVNTPYPATSFLTGFLRSRGFEAEQRDVGLEWVLKIFSARGLALIQKHGAQSQHPSVQFFLEAFEDYQKTIEPVIRFLQGRDPALAHRIAARTLLPEGPRFSSVDTQDLDWAFGSMGVQDQAKHLASLYIDDLTDVIQAAVDSEFSLSRYGEKLAASQARYDPIQQALVQGSPLDPLLDEVVKAVYSDVQPDVVLLSVPFPGSLLGALKVARRLKQLAHAQSKTLRIAMGGGYVNTELRTLKDARIFDDVDALTLDDGERPLECLLEYWNGARERHQLFRTFLRSEKIKTAVEYCHDDSLHDIPQTGTGYPTADGLPIQSYLSMVEMLNPMHRYWSDLYWNKVMLAHGCYWHQCSFCDVSLDYIGRYEISPADLTLERMRRLKVETGSSGFHFVDEAAPPALLRDLSQKILDAKESFVWWGNIRFERTFTAELTEKMSDAGCVAVSGGLEVASDRLLKLMKKGVTVQQVAQVTQNFRRSNILVHAYLMYGFPTETLQETIDSLERVRQLFEAGCLSSAFWHRFSATAHSPIGLDPEAYGIHVRRNPEIAFAENDLEFQDPSGVDHDRLGAGLRKAVYNYMLGIGIEEDVRSWFSFQVPKAQVDPGFIRKSLRAAGNSLN